MGIVGFIACGIPDDAEEHLEGFFPVPTSLVNDDKVYILYAHGKSMIDAGINENDMVLVRRQEEAHHGDIVVAYVEGEGNTLKRLLYKEDGPVLHPENKKMKDIPTKWATITYSREEGFHCYPDSLKKGKVKSSGEDNKRVL